MDTWKQFCKHPLGKWALAVVILYVIVGVYAPFLASSRPIVVNYEGVWYFPLFRYLFYPGFYTKWLDIFFNLLMFTLPLMLLFRNRWMILGLSLVQVGGFIFIINLTVQDPAASASLNQERNSEIDLLRSEGGYLPSWSFDLHYMTSYAKLNHVLRYLQRQQEHEKLVNGFPQTKELPTLWQLDRNNELRSLELQEAAMQGVPEGSSRYLTAAANVAYLKERKVWLEHQSEQVAFRVMPLLRPYHWEEDAGGHQSLNYEVSFWDLTRITRKDLVAGLIFGVRISLVVGILAVSLALAIGIPVGAFAGYYGGTFDIIVSRLLEIWESMPTLFMLLLVVAVTQSKSIFLVIGVIGIFGWTGFSRYIRGEFFKQRNLPYVEACHAQGFKNSYIIFTHVLPNAIPPLLTLLPFAIMGAITSEAALSFLGLGEEGSCSWGVLMDEGRSAFPGESYLLWPPAILLTVLLISIALVGDALRDTLDPKMRQ